MTHINAYKDDVLKALGEAHDALSKAEAKLQALLDKINETSNPVEPTVEPSAPVVDNSPAPKTDSKVDSKKK